MESSNAGGRLRPQALRDLYPQIFEEGLEQEFNSLAAQREACEAFIRSQRQRGLGIGSKTA